MDALDLSALVRGGSVSVADVLACAAERIATTNGDLNAVVHHFPASGGPAVQMGATENLPFAGVPFLYKDTSLRRKETPLTSGSRLFRDEVCTDDSTLALRYADAGLLALGRTNVPEFAMSFTTEGLAHGIARNPWDQGRSTGGSSGGSAAAVAAGMVPIAHATDGAGSIRLPAAHCGVFGFKPSRMHNPLGPRIAEGNAGMATAHAISRTVRDSAALMDVSAGGDVGDPYAAPAPGCDGFLKAAGLDPEPLRIGLLTTSPVGNKVDPEVAAVAAAAGALCESLGHMVEPVAVPYSAQAVAHAWRVISGVALADRLSAVVKARGNPANWRDDVEPVNVAWFEEGCRWDGVEYLRSVAILHDTSRQMGRFFERFDILLSPVASEAAPPLGKLAGHGKSVDTFYEEFWEHSPFTCAFNASGCPAMSVPLGHTRQNLPVGVHFGARFGADAILFSLAGQLERAKPWRNSFAGLAHAGRNTTKH